MFFIFFHISNVILNLNKKQTNKSIYTGQNAKSSLNISNLNNIYLTVYISKQFLIQSSVSKWIILLHHIQVYLYLYMFYELFQYIISRLILVHLSYPKNIFIHWPIKQFLCNFFSYALLFTENRKKIQISLHIRFILFNF